VILVLKRAIAQHSLVCSHRFNIPSVISQIIQNAVDYVGHFGVISFATAMHISLVSSTILLSIPFASAQLNILAKESGKIYFGSATDNPELTDAPYVKQLGNTQDFGQLTPVGFTHVMSFFVIDFSPGEQHEMGMTCFIFDMHALLNTTVQSMQLNQLEVISRLQPETKSWIWPRKIDNSFEVHKVFCTCEISSE
jgi:hypothetical protein